jgi:RNA polymerase sigma-70 factor (ECF subfamily)
MPLPAELTPPSDVELVASLRAGDDRGATRLVERHAAVVARFLYSAGADRSDLDDLVQETFIRAFRRIESWRGESPFRSWLFAIAANLHRDELRRRKGIRWLALEAHDAPTGATPETELEGEELADRLRAGIATLPRLQREVFLRRVQTGEEYATIAAALGTTTGAARVHYHHAVKRLKELTR